MAGDNDTDETLDGKQTKHAITLVLYQRGQFVPAPKERPVADHSQRKRSLGRTVMVQDILVFCDHGKRSNHRVCGQGVCRLVTEYGSLGIFSLSDGPVLDPV